MRLFVLLVLGCCLGACYRADLAAKRERADAGSEPGSSGSNDAGTPDSTSDAALGLVPDAATQDAGSALPKHPRCAQALDIDARIREFMPQEGAILPLDGGPYDVNAWSKLACDAPDPLESCDLDHPCRFSGPCLRLAPNLPGYCAVAVPPSDEPFVYTDLTFRAGDCASYASPEVKAALCCASVPGVDCRLWPSDKKSSLGEVCRVRSDCETGLVCAPRGSNFGACACPGEARGLVANRPDCDDFSVPSPWGMPSKAGPVGGCSASLVQGFVQENLAAVPGQLAQLRIARDPAGNFALYAVMNPLLISPGEESLHLWTDGAATWPDASEEQVAFGLRHLSIEPVARGSFTYLPLALAFSAQGALHLAFGNTLELLLRSPNSKGWEERSFAASAEFVALALDSAGLHHVGYLANTGLYHAVDEGKAFNVSVTPYAQEGEPHFFGVLMPVAGPLIVVGGSEGQAFDPNGGDVTLLGNVHDAQLGADDSLWAVGVDDALHEVTLWGGPQDGDANAPAPVWRAPSTDEALDPSLVLRTDGPLVLHRSPEGIALSSKVGMTWSTTTLSTERGSPRAMLDRDGKLQVFFLADTNWDGFPDQLRRLREGSCPF